MQGSLHFALDQLVPKRGFPGAFGRGRPAMPMENELFDLPFISVDESPRHLIRSAGVRSKDMCEKKMALAEALFETRMTVLRVKVTVAWSRPYIAAERGHAAFDKARRKG